MLRRLIIMALFLLPSAAMAHGSGTSNALGHTIRAYEKAPVRMVHMSAQRKPLKMLHPLAMLSRVSRYGNTGEDGELTF